jgi:hypothetical protein
MTQHETTLFTIDDNGRLHCALTGRFMRNAVRDAWQAACKAFRTDPLVEVARKVACKVAGAIRTVDEPLRTRRESTWERLTRFAGIERPAWAVQS